ncbi:MAG: MarR family transcriptional regulator [Formosimonas sp.]
MHTESSLMSQTSPKQKFVHHFGEMGGRWGINRTVGQVYALLYISKEPLVAEQISEMLGFSRSNVSIGLKELNSWRLIKMSHLAGDRREYFSSLGDIWEIFRAVASERHRREIQPTATVLREIMLETPQNEDDAHAQVQIKKMCELFELANMCIAELQNCSPEDLKRMIKLGGQMKSLLEMKDALTFKKARSAKKALSAPEAEK